MSKFIMKHLKPSSQVFHDSKKILDYSYYHELLTRKKTFAMSYHVPKEYMIQAKSRCILENMFLG